MDFDKFIEVQKQEIYNWHLSFNTQEGRDKFICELAESNHIRKREFNRMIKYNKLYKTFYIKLFPQNNFGYHSCILCKYGHSDSRTTLEHNFSFKYNTPRIKNLLKQS